MGKEKNRQQAVKQQLTTKTTKILGWNTSESFKKKLIEWTIEGLIISVITFAILWLPLIIK